MIVSEEFTITEQFDNLARHGLDACQIKEGIDYLHGTDIPVTEIESMLKDYSEVKTFLGKTYRKKR